MLSIFGGSFEGSPPAPEAFGEGVDGGSHSKAIVTIEKNAIEKVGLPGSIETCH